MQIEFGAIKNAEFSSKTERLPAVPCISTGVGIVHQVNLNKANVVQLVDGVVDTLIGTDSHTT